MASQDYPRSTAGSPGGLATLDGDGNVVQPIKRIRRLTADPASPVEGEIWLARAVGGNQSRNFRIRASTYTTDGVLENLQVMESGRANTSGGYQEIDVQLLTGAGGGTVSLSGGYSATRLQYTNSTTIRLPTTSTFSLGRMHTLVHERNATGITFTIAPPAGGTLEGITDGTFTLTSYKHAVSLVCIGANEWKVV